MVQRKFYHKTLLEEGQSLTQKEAYVLLRGDYTPAFGGDNVDPPHPAEFNVYSIALHDALDPLLVDSVELYPFIRRGLITLPRLDEYIQEAVEFFESQEKGR